MKGRNLIGGNGIFKELKNLEGEMKVQEFLTNFFSFHVKEAIKEFELGNVLLKPKEQPLKLVHDAETLEAFGEQYFRDRVLRPSKFNKFSTCLVFEEMAKENELETKFEGFFGEKWGMELRDFKKDLESSKEVGNAMIDEKDSIFTSSSEIASELGDLNVGGELMNFN